MIELVCADRRKTVAASARAALQANSFGYRSWNNNALSLRILILSGRLPILESLKRKQGCLRKTRNPEVSIMKLATIIIAAALAVPAVRLSLKASR